MTIEEIHEEYLKDGNLHKAVDNLLTVLRPKPVTKKVAVKKVAKRG